MNLSLIVTLVVAAYAVILGVIYMVKASKRSWVMAIVRIGVTVASAIAAIPLTRMLADLTADTVYGFLRPYLGDEIVSFLDQVPVGAEGMRVLAALLVAFKSPYFANLPAAIPFFLVRPIAAMNNPFESKEEKSK